MVLSQSQRKGGGTDRQRTEDLGDLFSLNGQDTSRERCFSLDVCLFLCPLELFVFFSLSLLQLGLYFHEIFPVLQFLAQ